MNRKLKIHWPAGCSAGVTAMPLAHAEEIGSADTASSGWGRTTRSSSRLSTIPRSTVTCYVSRSQVGGIKGG